MSLKLFLEILGPKNFLPHESWIATWVGMPCADGIRSWHEMPSHVVVHHSYVPLASHNRKTLRSPTPLCCALVAESEVLPI